MAAGAQHIESGIHRGLVSRNNKMTQKQSPARISTTLEWSNMSRRKISEKSKNFRRNFAICRVLNATHIRMILMN